MMRLTRRGLYGFAIGALLALPATAARADDLCPDTTKGEEGVSVNDMAGLQFDIGRLNLCLQRARLLQQIDEIVKKREDLRTAPVPAVEVSSLGGTIPRMTTALPPLPGDAAIKSAVPVLPSAQPILAPKPAGEWKIRRIWGQGNVMQAQLVKDDIIANVKSGDALPTGEVVAELSGKGVSLNNGKQTHALVWADDVASGKNAMGEAGTNQ